MSGQVRPETRSGQVRSRGVRGPEIFSGLGQGPMGGLTSGPTGPLFSDCVSQKGPITGCSLTPMGVSQKRQ
jgi:hypothetical protein